MTANTDPYERVLRSFKRERLLMESDPLLPSVVGIVIGGRIRGSWWGHPKGKEIWRVLKRFSARSDVLATRLVSGKVTFVHRTLWPELLSVCRSGEDWQEASLSRGAKRLLAEVKKKGEVRTDKTVSFGSTQQPVGDSTRELERRLLVYSEEIHTEKGTHAKLLLPWGAWARRNGYVAKTVEVQAAKATLERTVSRLNERYGAKGRLPWIN
ncbi:MAG: hypothetical protein OK422_06305 [Thaumarchaeota archaeon]|nr:hypothetical protein [Nitrososphaerota archaeon]